MYSGERNKDDVRYRGNHGIEKHVISIFYCIMIEGFTNEEKWVTALLSTEGEARMDNDALKPRLKAEVSMEGYHFLSW